MSRNKFYLIVTAITIVIGIIIFVCIDLSPLSILKFTLGWLLFIFFFAFLAFFTAIIAVIARKTWEPLLGIGRYENDEEGLYMTGVCTLSIIALCFVLVNVQAGSFKPELRAGNILKYVNTVPQKMEFLGMTVGDGHYLDFERKYDCTLLDYSYQSTRPVVLRSMGNDPDGLVEVIKKYYDIREGKGLELIKGAFAVLAENGQVERLNGLLSEGYADEASIPLVTDKKALVKYLKARKNKPTKELTEAIRKRIDELE